MRSLPPADRAQRQDRAPAHQKRPRLDEAISLDRRVQNHYNLVHHGDDKLIDKLGQDRIAYVPFFPLGGFSPLQSSSLSAVENRIGTTPMQVAFAWLFQRAPNILLIPGTSSVAHLRENLAAHKLVLTQNDLDELARISENEAPSHAGHEAAE